MHFIFLSRKHTLQPMFNSGRFTPRRNLVGSHQSWNPQQDSSVVPVYGNVLSKWWMLRIVFECSWKARLYISMQVDLPGAYNVNPILHIFQQPTKLPNSRFWLHVMNAFFFHILIAVKVKGALSIHSFMFLNYDNWLKMLYALIALRTICLHS